MLAVRTAAAEHARHRRPLLPRGGVRLLGRHADARMPRCLHGDGLPVLASRDRRGDLRLALCRPESRPVAARGRRAALARARRPAAERHPDSAQGPCPGALAQPDTQRRRTPGTPESTYHSRACRVAASARASQNAAAGLPAGVVAPARRGSLSPPGAPPEGKEREHRCQLRIRSSSCYPRPPALQRCDPS